jgi:predicted nuclease with TOPRIM domain
MCISLPSYSARCDIELKHGGGAQLNMRLPKSSLVPVAKEGRTMREQIQARLEELKQELERGQAELHKLDTQRTYLHETVLRVSGAVQVLEELLREGQSNRGTRVAPEENTVPQLRKE